MTAQADLFDPTRYPSVPGSARGVDTSIAAAESVKEDVAYLQGLCRDALEEFGPMTADEIAKKVKRSRFSIRPRCTEMKAKGEFFDSGERRKNDSGRNAMVWRVKA